MPSYRSNALRAALLCLLGTLAVQRPQAAVAATQAAAQSQSQSPSGAAGTATQPSTSGSSNPVVHDDATAMGWPGQDKSPEALAAPRPTTPLVARGEYVAIEADCASCHSAPGGKPFAGGYPLKSPIGILYGPNITQDVETGIGSWTEADFEKAIRHGISKNGSYIYPAMPYENYTHMTQEDLDALWAFMRTIRPVHNVPPKDTLPFPFTIRDGIAVWQALYLRQGPFVPDPHKSAQWNRGAYLVDVMGHCNQCHTPRNLAMQVEAKHNLAGATIEGWYAPDISNDNASVINKWNAHQLEHFFKTGVFPNNEKAVGPMQEAVHTSLSLLKDSDLLAISVYLKDQPKITPVGVTAAKYNNADAGRLVYVNNCQSCHQADGKGIPGSVPSLAGDGAVTAGEPYNVIMALLEGFKAEGTYGAMSSYANALTDDQIAAVANYVRTAWGNNAVPNATPWGVGNMRKTADAPAPSEAHAMLCPSLSLDLMQPALQAGPATLKQAASDNATMSKLVGNYRSARPKTSPAQVVEALSTAYCRAVSTDPISQARVSYLIEDFAERVATALNVPKNKT